MSRLKCFVVSHTHWDREWYQPFQEFRVRLVGMVDRLLAVLDADPEFRHFMLDGQTIVLEDYLAVRPDRRAELRRLVASGRLLVGPWYILPDEFLVSPESLVRNLLLGRRVADRFGQAMPVGYIPDTFGHMSQLPQVLRGFGLDSAVLWRGLPDLATAFTWRSPDGTEVTGLNLREGYGDLAWAPGDEAGFAVAVQQAAARLGPHAVSGCIVLMDGTDHMEARADLPRLISAANGILASQGLYLVHSTLPAYLASLRSGAPALEEVSGEFRSPWRSNVLPGVLSARMWVKQRNRELETLLASRAEPFTAIAGALGGAELRGLAPESVAGLLAEAWRLLLQNQPHDSICGCSVDQVHEEMRYRYDQAEQIGRALTRDAFIAVAANVDTVPPNGAETIPVLVFNPVGHAASGTVSVTVQAPPWWDDMEVVDATGAPVPWDSTGSEKLPFSALGIDAAEMVTRLSVENAERIAGQSVLRLSWERRGREVLIQALLGGHDLGDRTAVEAASAALRALMAAAPDLRPRLDIEVAPRSHLAIAAQAIPALGYAVYHVRGGGSSVVRDGRFSRLGYGPTSYIENEYLRVSADEADGTLVLTDKRTGRVLPGLSRLVDDGDRGDEYNFCPVTGDAPVDRPSGPPSMQVLQRGATSQELLVVMTYGLPCGITMDRSRRRARKVPVGIAVVARLVPGVARLDLEVSLDNVVEDHRLRVAFPLPWAPATWRTETPWDVVERSVTPPGFERDPAHDSWQERPVAQQPQYRFCDVSVPGAGMTVANRGLPEVEARRTDGAAGAATLVYLTLLRCVGCLSRDDLPTRRGHAGPGLATPGAQCLGRHRFEYALIPHGGDWLTALPLVESFAAPLQAVTTGQHAGPLPSRHAFVTVDDAAVTVSALKRTTDGHALALRLWNASAGPVNTRVRLGVTLASARLSRLDESEGVELPLERDGSLPVRLEARQAVTVLLYPR